MEIADMLGLVRRRWPTILMTTLIGLGLGIAALSLLPKQYEARTEALVTATGGTTPDQRLSASNLARHRAKAYVEAITTPLVLQPVADRVGYPGGTAALESQVEAGVGLDSVILSVSVMDLDAGRARAVANAIIEQLDQVLPELEGSDTPAIALTVLRPATLPTGPISPNQRVILVVATAAGLFLGGLMALVQDRLAQRRVGLERRDTPALTTARRPEAD